LRNTLSLATSKYIYVLSPVFFSPAKKKYHILNLLFVFFSKFFFILFIYLFLFIYSHVHTLFGFLYYYIIIVLRVHCNIYKSAYNMCSFSHSFLNQSYCHICLVPLTNLLFYFLLLAHTILGFVIFIVNDNVLSASS
jgi:hypothetical protein